MRSYIILILVAIGFATCTSMKNKNNEESNNNISTNNKLNKSLIDQTNTPDSTINDTNEDNAMLRELFKNKKNDVDRARSLQIYSQDSLMAQILVCNYKIESLEQKRFKKNVNEKNYITKNEFNDSVNITLYHSNNSIISIMYSIFKNSKRIKMNSFVFDEGNNCISHNQWSTEIQYSFSDVIYNGSIIRYDCNNNYIDITSEKTIIITATKTFLNSIMQHFPEFKYSFYWK